MANMVYCKYCGMEFSSVRNLINNYCMKHPAGKNGFHHELYEGSEKPQYTCKYCGMTFKTLRILTNNYCQRHPAGRSRSHEPAL